MFQALLLICAATVAPGDCTPETARLHSYGERALTAHACIISAQELMASLAIGPLPNKEYLRVECKRVA